MKALFSLLVCIPLCAGFKNIGNKGYYSTGAVNGGLSVQIIDITPKFLRFYDSASVRSLDPENRWQLWKEMYNFAAVQPGLEGDKMARTLLDNAWPKYPQVMERIRQGASILNPSPKSILKDVAEILHADTITDSIKVKLIVYVGGLEDNAFAFSDHGIPVVAIPVEINNKELALTMTHEFTHAVHLKTASRLSPNSPSSVALLVFREGLAMRVTEKLIPGEKPEIYTNAHSDTWLKTAEERNIAILNGIQQHLTDTAASARSQFIYGNGTTGLKREAYYAGWVLVGALEKQGMSLAQLSRLSQPEIEKLLSATINKITRQRGK